MLPKGRNAGGAAGDGGRVDLRRPPPIWAGCPVMHSLHLDFCCHIQHISAMITELWPPVIQALHSNTSTLVRDPPGPAASCCRHDHSTPYCLYTWWPGPPRLHPVGQRPRCAPPPGKYTWCRDPDPPPCSACARCRPPPRASARPTRSPPSTHPPCSPDSPCPPSSGRHRGRITSRRWAARPSQSPPAAHPP